MVDKKDIPKNAVLIKRIPFAQGRNTFTEKYYELQNNKGRKAP